MARGRRLSGVSRGVLAPVSGADNRQYDEDEDDDESFDDRSDGAKTKPTKKRNKNTSTLSKENIGNDSDSDSPELTLSEAANAAAIQKSKEDGNSQQQAGGGKKKRRRSSARFLRLSGRFEGDNEDEEENSEEMNSDRLGEMYAMAIKMNAENKINAQNTWSLQLIDNMSSIIAPKIPAKKTPAANPNKVKNNGPVSKFTTAAEEDDFAAINFQKASCTLDASVKIYSYRVDDVHLSSYKVLANLNRTGNDKSDDDNEDESGNATKKKAPAKVGDKKASEKRGLVQTLELNRNNLNMNKLDSAFDIDPLFHKMSKTFDEGGAKGMLLANLSVGTDGCGVVFDSKEDTVDPNSADLAAIVSDDDDEVTKMEAVRQLKVRAAAAAGESGKASKPVIDISSLNTKLKSLLANNSVESLQLVPQLSSIRSEYEALKAEGHVAAPEKKKSKRYANSAEDDAEAEQEIVREHLEKSMTQKSMHAMMNETSPTIGHDDEEDEGDDDFDGYMAMDDGADNYDGDGFTNDDFDSQGNEDGVGNIIDAIARRDVDTEGDVKKNTYSYYSLEEIIGTSKLAISNSWAGAAHWKKGTSSSASAKVKVQVEGDGGEGEDGTAATTTVKRGKKVQTFINLKSAVDEDIFDADSGKKLSLTDAALKKQLLSMNLLPHDSGVVITSLSRLFLRPHAAVRSSTVINKGGGVEGAVSNNNNGFDDIERDDDLGFGGDDMGGGNYDDDDVGSGGGNGAFAADHDFAESDNYVVQLAGVRKIEKIDVGYATVSKKVDVKRLKRDLWTELASNPIVCNDDDDEEEEEENAEEGGEKKIHREPVDISNASPISFKETCDTLDLSQKQEDVSTAYYFICVLHLANEKGLKLEGQEDMLDFKIRKDYEIGDRSITGGGGGSTAVPVVAEKEFKKARKSKKAAYVEEIDEDDDDGDDNFEDAEMDFE